MKREGRKYRSNEGRTGKWVNDVRKKEVETEIDIQRKY
jgi:hypothetical protein